MSIAIDYTPVEYQFEGGLFTCEHASVHAELHGFYDGYSDAVSYYDTYVPTCDECGAWFNELTNDWEEL